MMRFNFSINEIKRNIGSKENWHKFVRSREIEFSLSLLDGKKFEKGLEIGAGDGGQSNYLSSICKSLICTEVDENSHSWLSGNTILDRDEKNIEYRISDAQDLSCFESESFDLIYSSNVLEHIVDINKCFSECARVLMPDGIMLHMMPTRWWKAFNFMLFLFKFKYPVIHGEFSNHYEEFLAFGLNEWKKKFNSAGFDVVKVAALPFYVGHGHHFRFITMLGNALGLPGSYAYVVHKKSSK